ncbi:hypothetical protein ACN20G_33495 (plasmid) [Streptomyces sp. BI20]|uniref:hypothetical protein n=1 Tax=Streptomyces sp. BI20 TaxID=3403460 RepID=UPI003C708D86
MRQFVSDAWSWLNYKPIMAGPSGLPHRSLGPGPGQGWVPAEDARRLAAYKVLAAYDSNQAGELAALAGIEAGRERREYGDAAVLVTTTTAHLLGRSQQIEVSEADGDDAVPGAVEVQDRLRAWAEAELFPLRLQAAERKAVLLGDAVYLLAWDPERGRVRLRTVDPGFYFPVLADDGDPGDYPTRVHLAWELPEDPERGLGARVRRITYELGPLPEPETGRVHPWSERPSAVTCYLTDAEWDLADLRMGQTVDALPLDRARVRARQDGTILDRLDLRIDFVPLVHVTNSVDDGEHFGRSALAPVMQALDELAETDTDSARASATTGSPILGLSGVRTEVDRVTGRPRPLAVVPGAVFQLGESGRLDVVDTSGQLAELRARVEEIRDRAATNARLPAVALGTADPTRVPSGYALELSMGPLDALVGSMRLARAHKYALLLKMVQRLHQAGQAEGWPAGPSVPARLVFGPHTPVDRSEVLDEVVRAVTAGLLSRETGVRMLQVAGYPVEDVAAELGRVDSGQPDPAATRPGPEGPPSESS